MSGAAISTLDPPFLAPLECVVDLPFPPSTNRIWSQARGNRIIISEVYRSWKAQADMAVVANGCWRKRVAMPGSFAAEILLDHVHRGRRPDVDNRIKAVLDWAERVELIKNDNLCDDVRARWVVTIEAPRGCRLILRSVA